MKRTVPTILLGMTLLTMLAGCSREANDARLVEQAKWSVEQQARQNEQVARQSQTVAEQGKHLTQAAQNLVESDAAARRELIESQKTLSQELHDERAGVDRQREALEDERRTIAHQRHRDPILAAAIQAAGLLLACLLPLLVCIYVLSRITSETPEEELGELLVHELSAEEPKLLPMPDPVRLEQTPEKIGAARLSAHEVSSDGDKEA